MDAINSSAKELLEKMDMLIADHDRNGLYLIEKKTSTVVIKSVNPVVRKNLIICAAEREESVYMKKTVFSCVDTSLKESPTIQLSKLYDAISRYLLRFANDFPEEYLQEGMSFFVENNVSGDLLSKVSIEGNINPEKVLPDLASRMIPYSISATLRIYKALQLKFKKSEYYLASALIYMELGDYATAYKVLSSSENKSPEIEQILKKIQPKIQ